MNISNLIGRCYAGCLGTWRETTMPRRTLSLTPDQRRELERVRDRDRRPYLREMAAGLLKIADGMAPYAVARQGLHRRRKPETVYRWLRKYHHGGVSAL